MQRLVRISIEDGGTNVYCLYSKVFINLKYEKKNLNPELKFGIFSIYCNFQIMCNI